MTTRVRTGRLAGTTALRYGASQGLGRAATLAFARGGTVLLLVAGRQEPLERVREEVAPLGARTAAMDRLDIEGGSRWQ